MRPWVRLMSKQDIADAHTLSAEHSLEELRALVFERLKKDVRIALWIMASMCISTVAIFFVIVALRDGLGHPLLPLGALGAALLLPLPAMRVAKEGHRQGRILALAFLIKKGGGVP